MNAKLLCPDVTDIDGKLFCRRIRTMFDTSQLLCYLERLFSLNLNTIKTNDCVTPFLIKRVPSLVNITKRAF